MQCMRVNCVGRRFRCCFFYLLLNSIIVISTLSAINTIPLVNADRFDLPITPSNQYHFMFMMMYQLTDTVNGDKPRWRNPATIGHIVIQIKYNQP